MAKTFFSYKCLDSELIDNLRFGRTEFVLFDGSERKIDYKGVEGTANSYYINDNSGAWSPSDVDLKIEGSFSFSNGLSILFDEKKGVLGDKGTLGIACDWIANQSSVRGTFLIDSPINKNSSVKKYNYSFVFPKGIVRGEVLFSFYFYVYSKDEKTKNLPSFIANEKGIKLGEFFSFELFFDGNGSTFPVLDYDGNSGDPLWKLTLDISDPCEETITEKNCCLHINRAHKAYEDLMGKRQGGLDSYLHKEVMASAIQMLIEYSFSIEPELKEQVAKGERFNFGTIAYCISRFHNDLGIKTTSPPQILAESIREYLEG